MADVRLMLAVLALAGFSVSAASGTQAAFPGGAGRIAYTRTAPGGGTEVFSIAADGTGEKQLTEADGDSCCPAWSPDGERLAFFSNRGGNDEVYVMEGDGSNERVVGEHPAKEGAAAWSPDGKKIAFGSDRDGDFEVWVMNADGTGAVQLTNNEGFNDYNPAWSPDGSKIAFERNPLGPGGDREVWVMDAAGGNERNLTQDPAEDSGPDWSPDGSRIAFYTDRDGNYEVYSMNADGGGVQRLTDDPAVDRDPAWSPDGTKLAFASNRSGHFHVHVLEVASMEAMQVTSGDADAFSPDWQPVSLTPLSGDTDCTGTITAVDALQVLRGVAGLPVAGCAYAGDADCDGGRDAVDALFLLRHVAGIPPISLPPGCPGIGEALPWDPELAGGALATFRVVDETMRVWVTAPGTVQALHDLAWGRTGATIPAGPVRVGSGQGEHNAPWSWHLDPEETVMAEMTIELCDGRPSDVEADVEGWIAYVGSFCPWAAVLVEVVDYRWMTEAGAPAGAKGY